MHTVCPGQDIILFVVIIMTTFTHSTESGMRLGHLILKNSILQVQTVHVLQYLRVCLVLCLRYFPRIGYFLKYITQFTLRYIGTVKSKVIHLAR